MIVELQPDVEWHKGKALIWILRALQKDPKKTVQMYIGDDLTDENAFEVLQEDGIGILVGDHDATTFAKYRLENVDEVRLFLSRIHKLFREKDHE
jgi:alpha,alpha-trehalase